MKSVGLRELKNRLSEYVREVRSGEGVLVTDRGEVVAELLPPGQGLDESGVPSGLMALVRKGQLTLGASNEATLYPKLSPLLKRHRAAVLLDEERGTRLTSMQNLARYWRGCLGKRPAAAAVRWCAVGSS